MGVKHRYTEFIKGIDKLSSEEQQKLYQYMKDRIIESKEVSIDLKKYCGRSKGIWNKDAQEYINEMRSYERL